MTKQMVRIGFAAAVAFGFQAHGAQNSKFEAFKAAVSKLEHAKTMGEYVDKLDTDPTVVEFLKTKVGKGKSPVPKVKWLKPNLVGIQAGGLYVTMEMKEEVSETFAPHVVINGTDIVMKYNEPPSVLYDKIIQALPKTSASHFGMIPEAYAEDAFDIPVANQWADAGLGIIHNVSDFTLCKSFKSAVDLCSEYQAKNRNKELEVYMGWSNQSWTQGGRTMKATGKNIAGLATYLTDWKFEVASERTSRKSNGKGLSCNLAGAVYFNTMEQDFKKCLNQIAEEDKSVTFTQGVCAFMGMKDEVEMVSAKGNKKQVAAPRCNAPNPGKVPGNAPGSVTQ